MKKQTPADPLMTVPRHLSNRMRTWARNILDRYLIEPEDFAVLILIAEAWDDAEKNRKALAKHGTVYLDRFGSPRSRPEVAQLRDARLTFARLMKQLGLGDEEAPAEAATKLRPRVAPTLVRKG